MKSVDSLLSWSEIREDVSLRLLGAGLAATHVLTYLFWNGTTSATKYLFGPVRVCWSYFQSCDVNTPFSLESLAGYFIFYLVLAIASALLFFGRRFVGAACSILLLVTILKALVIAQDYRFMGNYHYMPFWLTVAFLFAPNKRQVCTMLLILFYVGAGLLKLNVEWLSGAAMIRAPLIQGKLLEWATAFVVVLELYLVFWLLSDAKWKRFAVILALIGFHAFSWHIVGFFYPSVMFCLLAFAILNANHGERIDWKRVSLYPLPALFLICQLIPLVFFPNSAVTGVGRILSLNMFDAKTVCQTSLLAKRGNEIVELPPLIEGLGVRIACDPLVHLAQAKAYCRELATSDDRKVAPTISVRVISKATSDRAAIDVLHADDVCTKPPRVSWWGTIQ